MCITFKHHTHSHCRKQNQLPRSFLNGHADGAQISSGRRRSSRCQLICARRRRDAPLDPNPEQRRTTCFAHQRRCSYTCRKNPFNNMCAKCGSREWFTPPHVRNIHIVCLSACMCLRVCRALAQTSQTVKLESTLDVWSVAGRSSSSTLHPS